MTMHYVNVGLFQVDFNGVRIDKGSPNTTISAVLNSTMDYLVIPDNGVTNSAGYPTIKAYLTLEAADGYQLQYMDQNKIITYNIALT